MDGEPPKSSRSRLLQPVLRVFAALMMVFGGIRIVAIGSAPMGVFLFTLGGITFALAARQLFNKSRSPDSGVESSGVLAKDEFDYIVWFALGLPVVLVLGLLVFVLTGYR